MWTNTSRIGVAAVAVLAAACGGGGDDGGAPPPPATAFVKISAANQDTVARASVGSIMPFMNVPALSTSPAPSRVTVAQATIPAAHGHGGLAGFALRSADIGLKQLPSVPSDVVRPLARYTATEPCIESGTMTVVWDDNDNSTTITAGDSMSVSFSQCSDAVGSAINGGLGMSISAYSQTPAAADMSGSMTFQSLTMVDDGVSFSLTGGVGFHINEAQVTNGVNALSSYTVSSGGLTVVDTGSAVGFSDTFTYRAGYSVTDRDFFSNAPGIASTEELTASGDFGSQALGGDLSLATAQPFRSTYLSAVGDVFPTEGQLIATGLDSTKLSLSATNSSQVRMDMCDDGDGAWEATKMVEWSWLLQ